MSRLPSPTASPSPRVTLRSALSWKHWRRSLRLRRLARLERRFRLRQERAALLLSPLWEQQLRPLVQEVTLLRKLTLQTEQALTRLEQVVEQRPPEETRELLLEILSSLQPSPEAEIAQRLGLPLSSPSSPSSTS